MAIAAAGARGPHHHPARPARRSRGVPHRLRRRPPRRRHAGLRRRPRSLRGGHGAPLLPTGLVDRGRRCPHHLRAERARPPGAARHPGGDGAPAPAAGRGRPGRLRPPPPRDRSGYVRRDPRRASAPEPEPPWRAARPRPRSRATRRARAAPPSSSPRAAPRRSPPPSPRAPGRRPARRPAPPPGTKVTPSTSATTQSPAATRTPPTRTGAPDGPRLVLRRAGERDGRREDREAVRLERGDVAHAAVEDQARQPGRLGRRREHLAPVAAVGHLPDVDDEHAAPRCLRHRHVHGQVVARGAADRVGRGGQRGAGPGRPQPAVGGAPTRLAQRRRTQRGQCRRGLVVAVRRSHVVPPRASPVPAGLLPSGSRAFDHRAGPAHQPYTPRVPDNMLIVTQVAPYVDGPAGVHGVLAQAATGLAELAESGRPRPRPW